MLEFIKKHSLLLLVLMVASLMLLPFLGLTEFNTKGEPREAVVALSMLNDGNWILPINNGGDIPYKPPFFHFCIALVSLLTGGISEYTSRLPSALSLIAMTVGCFSFYAHRRKPMVALIGALLLLTSFEVHRAGVSCRVDMMLTAFVVGALLLFYRWWERGKKGLPLLAILCMSGAVLTKGPIGFVLPCFVMGVFSLLRGERLLATIGRYALYALLSCILPIFWYVAAWHEGGQEFLNLVYEENIGRMTGTMSYESHAHPFTYNFVTLITGWLPWTLFVIVSLFWRPWRNNSEPQSVAENQPSSADSQSISADYQPSSAKGFKQRLLRIRYDLLTMRPLTLFTWLSFVLILFFYCLPSSKRSVYLLPCYPFMAMLLAHYMHWLWHTRSRAIWFAYMAIIGVLIAVVTIVFFVAHYGLVPDSIFHGKHAAENISMLNALRNMSMGTLPFCLVLFPLYAVGDNVLEWFKRRNTMSMPSAVYGMFVPVILLFITLEGVYQPTLLSAKSLRPMSEIIAQRFAGEPLYAYIKADMMHFFGANYYLGNTINEFEGGRSIVDGRIVNVSTTPDRGVLIIPDYDFAEFASRHTDYRFTHVYTTPRQMSEVRSNVSFYRFERIKSVK